MSRDMVVLASTSVVAADIMDGVSSRSIACGDGARDGTREVFRD